MSVNASLARLSDLVTGSGRYLFVAAATPPCKIIVAKWVEGKKATFSLCVFYLFSYGSQTVFEGSCRFYGLMGYPEVP